MLKIRLRRGFSGLVAAILLAVLSVGCDGGNNSGSGTTTSPPPTITMTVPPPPADPLASLQFKKFWLLTNLGCVSPELKIQQTPDVATLISICWRSTGVVRVLNVSANSVRASYPSGSLTVQYLGPHEPDGQVTAAVLTNLGAAFVAAADSFVLPAGDSAVVRLSDLQSTFNVAAEPSHGRVAFYVRTIAQLVEQVPWGKLGDGVPAKTASCVSGALRVADSTGEWEIDKAIKAADQCRKMFEEISKKWDGRVAKVPTADALGTRFGELAHEGAGAENGIRNTGVKLLKTLLRHT